ncbi:hypothetical protein C5167_040498 [Papaver somniferum]|uniref:Uncharacterized protein n=1 Tax=Papaver somniferum TaxID=3469 RepID=A0A4Y7IJC4_PAPSO|nr:hypothetical protein C5167_040498 [Papaver somniferum]
MGTNEVKILNNFMIEDNFSFIPFKDLDSRSANTYLTDFVGRADQPHKSSTHEESQWSALYGNYSFSSTNATKVLFNLSIPELLDIKERVTAGAKGIATRSLLIHFESNLFMVTSPLSENTVENDWQYWHWVATPLAPAVTQRTIRACP